MIIYNKRIFKQILGSSFVSPASGWAGQGRLFRRPLAKNFLAKPKRAPGREGKGVWGKGPEGPRPQIEGGAYGVKIPAPPERIF